jgi:dipeptidyl aminopeptidase/acylaminoacyl peptidase
MTGRRTAIEARVAQAVARSLAEKQKKYELLIIKDGNHSLTRHEWREALLTRLEAFLAAHH